MRTTFALLLGTATLLSGCYVIPLDQHGRPSNVAYSASPVAPPAALPPASLHLVARLYPANDLAAATGILVGQVTNSLNGKGSFTLTAGSESYAGEATRSGQHTSVGVANATGSRGGYLSCRYTMNTSSQGSGECEFASGARYTMHLGN